MSGTFDGHGVHVGMLLGPALLLAVWAGAADLRAWLRRQDPAVPTAVLIGALLSVGAALLHALAAPAHLAESWLYGAFFVTAAGLQAVWAYAVVAGHRDLLLRIGIAGQLSVVAVWAVSRTYGLPLGPAAGRREPVGVVDLACTLLEVAAIACCAAALTSRQRTPALA